MFDITPYRELKIAPRAVFDALDERRARPRFMLPTASGDWEAVTWGAYADAIRKLACALSALGLGVGDRAAIFAPNRVQWIEAALAIQAAGGVMVPVYPACTAEQAAYIVAHSDAKVLFVDTAALLSRVFERFGELGSVQRVVLLDDALDVSKVLAELRASGKPAHSGKKLSFWIQSSINLKQKLKNSHRRLNDEPHQQNSHIRPLFGTRNHWLRH